MNIKRYFATDMRQALKSIREELGMDAVILSSRQTSEGLEVVAAIDYDEHLVDSAFRTPSPRASAGAAEQDSTFVDRLRRRRMGDETSELPGRPAADPRSTVEAARPKPRPVPTSKSAAAPGDRNSQTRRDLADIGPAADWRAPVNGHSSTNSIGNFDGISNGHSNGSSPGNCAPEAQQRARETSMQNEINALRRMLEGQLSRLAWHDFSRRSPLRAALMRDLLEMGLSAPLAQELAADVSDSGDLARAWREALGTLVRRIQVVDRDPLHEGGVVAVVGPTGAGKTTTIAKLAARYADRHGPENIAVITADDYRVGAQEQLFIYGRTLNVPIYSASSRDELEYRIEKLQHARLVLIDTAGSGYRDQEFQRLSEIIKSSPGRLIPYIVLAANAELRSLRETVAAFSSLPLAGVAVTKLDEAARLGGLLSVLIESELPVTWSSDGREVPENLRRASARNLVRLAAERMPGAERESIDEEVMAQQIGPMEFAFG